jgi:hypothetical protein
MRSVKLTIRLAVEFWAFCWLLGFLATYLYIEFYGDLPNGAGTIGGVSAVLAWWIAIWRQGRRRAPPK